MSQSIIRAEGLGKKYHIGVNRAMYPTLRETIMDSLKGPMRRAQRILRGQSHGACELDSIIWALRDVSFEVKQGEIIGIIGRNGAGKSTLLKVLTRITEPTEGHAVIRGRVGSLLEVGAGFHPELTGRENIFLNGAILGMRKAEILQRFDEIVAFSEVEQFLDTPVKNYSSGMFVKLAFAIAAHMEPDILVVDEVLAVGDIAFQKKCLGKMDTVAHEGRTVLFVSHNLGAIGQLCNRCMLMNNGKLINDGSVEDVIQKYIAEAAPTTSRALFDPPPTAAIGFREIWITDTKGNSASEVDVFSPLLVNMIIEVKEPVSRMDIGMFITNIRETPVTFSHLSQCNDGELPKFSPGLHRLQVEVPGQFLIPDTYKISVMSYVPGVRREHYLEHIASFTVIETGSNLSAHRDSWRMGCVFNNFQWRSIEPDGDPD